MGYRLSKIYTKTGDKGTTGLGQGQRVSKADLRIHAMGEVDELNSHIGVLLTDTGIPTEIRAMLMSVQHSLFDLGAAIFQPGWLSWGPEKTEELEQTLDALNVRLPPLKEFILPGGNHMSAQCHVARCVCRRAERALVCLHAEIPVHTEMLRYMNRLSDLLFVMARYLNRESGVFDEPLWHSGNSG